jgi:hypothetical protein
MRTMTFGELVVGDMFAYGSKTYTKQVGVCQGVDYNAEESKSGDYWQFEITDEVMFIKGSPVAEVKQEEMAHA